MITKLIASAAIAIALYTIIAGYTQSSALVLRDEKQDNYWPRRGTYLSGRYRRGIWEPLPNRSSYGSFRGGGIGSGK
ncbi:MAG: hypothetical protein ACOC0N_09695 [Chroococcales cyanobacterium]